MSPVFVTALLGWQLTQLAQADNLVGGGREEEVATRRRFIVVRDDAIMPPKMRHRPHRMYFKAALL